MHGAGPFDPTPRPAASPSTADDTATLDEGWAFGRGTLEPPRGPRRWVRPGRSFLALGLVLVLAVGTFVVLSGRSGGGTALALSLRQGQDVEYHLHMAMRGSMDAGGTKTAFDARIDEDLTWHVVSLDGQGVATITLSISNLSGVLNGRPVPGAASRSVRIRVARDGRILSAGDLGAAAAGSSSLSLPGTDQFTPLLPDHPVRPGQSWRKAFDQAFPFASGALHFTSRNTLQRYEAVDGARTAVITSTMTVPMDMTLEVRKMLSAVGGADGEVPAGANPAVVYSGTMRVEQTAWFDPARGALVKSATSGRFAIAMRFRGFPEGQQPPGAVGFDGTVAVQVTGRAR